MITASTSANIATSPTTNVGNCLATCASKSGWASASTTRTSTSIVTNYIFTGIFATRCVSYCTENSECEQSAERHVTNLFHICVFWLKNFILWGCKLLQLLLIKSNLHKN